MSSTAAAAAAGVLPLRPALALNIERAVAQLDAEATKRTEADFSSVVEIRPISGALGVSNALVIRGAPIPGFAADYPPPDALTTAGPAAAAASSFSSSPR